VGTLIDSSILIAAERRALQLDAALAAHPDEPVGIARDHRRRAPA
jgi:hypothetical protein